MTPIKAIFAAAANLAAIYPSTQNAMARRADGIATSSDDPEASCFCALGFIERASIDVGHSPRSSGTGGPFDLAVGCFRGHIGRLGVGDWNDGKKPTAAVLRGMFLELAA